MAEALTVFQAAQWLGISVGALRSRIAAGELRASIVDGQESVLVDDLNTWLEASRVRPGELSWSRQVRDPDTGRWRWRGRQGSRRP
ncbi:MAG: helix-turn-helix domain-containing protein [Actinomycetota bacterium]|nr:helix-turn-helix domain-containing protein [Actinomycetota bacterium]